VSSDRAAEIEIELVEHESALDKPDTAPPPEPTQLIGAAPETGLVLYSDARALSAIWRHAESAPDREVGGFLLGGVGQHGGGPYVRIAAAVRAEGAVESQSRLTFTQRSWDRVHEIAEREHPDAHTIGWYHTHPGFGVFLSRYDTFIHENFFASPYQVALVVDPIDKTHGFFIWEGGAIVRAKGHYAYGALDELALEIAAGARPGEWIDIESVAEVPADEDGMRAAAERFEEFVARAIEGAPHLLGRILADLQTHIAAAAERGSESLSRLVRARQAAMGTLHEGRDRGGSNDKQVP
jgi:proteasome lid subunit RPN8/RPN11